MVFPEPAPAGRQRSSGTFPVPAAWQFAYLLRKCSPQPAWLLQAWVPVKALPVSYHRRRKVTQRLPWQTYPKYWRQHWRQPTSGVEISSYSLTLLMFHAIWLLSLTDSGNREKVPESVLFCGRTTGVADKQT